MARRSNRKHGKIDGLAPELKATVEQMLLSDVNADLKLQVFAG